MERIDAAKELDDLLGHCSDVLHFAGYAMLGEPPQRVGYIRIVADEDGPMREWPERLTYRVALDVKSGVQLFVLSAPGEFLTPLLATEWDEACRTFVEAANARNVYLVELVQPSRSRTAMVMGSRVARTSESKISPEDYKLLRDVAWSESPECARERLDKS